MPTRSKKFNAPQQNVYGNLIQTPEEKQPEEKPKIYRFNAKMPFEYGQYLNELAWQKRKTITDVLNDIIREHMEAHPEIVDAIDILNK